jgi:glutathione S-transferase
VLKIYATPLSANGRKVLAVAEELDVQADIQLVNVYAGEGRRPAYLAVNPAGKIPTLIDGEVTLVESNAILVYLAEAHGGYELWSKEPTQRAQILRWLFWESAHWQPTLSAVLASHVAHQLFPERLPRPNVDPEWGAPPVNVLLEQLEGALQTKDFLAGTRPSIADFGVAGMATYFEVGRFPFGRYPAIARWYQALNERESWRVTRTSTFEPQ